jgi:hypothetical protein
LVISTSGHPGHLLGDAADGVRGRGQHMSVQCTTILK